MTIVNRGRAQFNEAEGQAQFNASAGGDESEDSCDECAGFVYRDVPGENMCIVTAMMILFAGHEDLLAFAAARPRGPFTYDFRR